MGTCESCGRDRTEVQAVERVYLLPPGEADDPGTAGPDGLVATPTGDVEQWCTSCREQYPHRAV